MSQRWPLALALVVGTGSGAWGSPGLDDRRAYDAWSLWTRAGDLASISNAITVELHGRPSYPNQPTGNYTASVERISVKAETWNPDGSVTVRTFSAEIGGEGDFLEGRGGFRLGPCYNCTPDGGVIFFALPSVFEERPTIVDIRLELPEAIGECQDAEPFTPCGGFAEGFHNPSFGYPLWLGDQDAADALPWPTYLA
jgi:hypothetical protein